jgi:hypothetical protein
MSILTLGDRRESLIMKVLQTPFFLKSFQKRIVVPFNILRFWKYQYTFKYIFI